MKQRLTASGIYLITNKVNGKVYVGSAKQFYRRWHRHRNDLRLGKHRNAHLQAAFTKYGDEAFVFSILLYCAAHDMDLYEISAIKRFNATDPRDGYNVREGGGNGGGFWGRRVSDATRAKMSAAHKGNKYNLGRKRSDEAKAKTSAALKGRPQGPNRKPAPPQSEATRLKKSLAAKKRIATEEGRLQLARAGAKGRCSPRRQRGPVKPPSEETRQKISDLAKRQWADGRGWKRKERV